jgi:hypothetical protein
LIGSTNHGPRNIDIKKFGKVCNFRQTGQKTELAIFVFLDCGSVVFVDGYNAGVNCVKMDAVGLTECAVGLQVLDVALKEFTIGLKECVCLCIGCNWWNLPELPAAWPLSRHSQMEEH